MVLRPRKGNRRPLSALRPLPWRWHLPAAAAGLLCGQSIGGVCGEDGSRLCVAAVLAAPALGRAHRAAGRAALLIALAATLGATQTWLGGVRREVRLASVPERAQPFHGRVRTVEVRPGRAGSRWAALEVALSDDGTWYRRGDRVRLSVWSTRRRWHVGEEIAFHATPRAPRGFCNGGRDRYAEHLWRRGIVALASVSRDEDVVVRRAAGGTDVSALLDAARDAIGAALERAVATADERSVLRALVLGDQSRIRTDLRRAYAATGTAHVLSVSGLHIALVATSAFASARWLLARVPPVALRITAARAAACVALPPALLYASLSGGATATLRALVMGAVGLAGIVLLRRTDAWTALAAAALLLALLDPGIAEDASFQLSFAAVASLVVVARSAPRWRAAAVRHGADPRRLAHRAVAWLTGALAASLAATLATGPITALHFGQVALLGSLANLVAVPLAGGVAVLLGLAGAALLPLSPDAGEASLWLAGFVLIPVDRLVEALAAMPLASARAALASPLEALAVVTALAGCVARVSRARLTLLGAAACLWALPTGAGWLAERAAPLAVRFLDVGQGDAAIVRLASRDAAIVGLAPDALTLLVDGGGLGGSFDPGERIVLPALRRARVRRVAALVLSHPEHDHYAGLAAVAANLPVDELWWNGRTGHGPAFARLEEALDAGRVLRRVLAAGDGPIGRRGAADEATPGGAMLSVVHPPRGSGALSQNDASLVILVQYGASRVLLTGDLEAAGEASLLRRTPQLTATVLKVPHHGSRTSSTRQLVARLRPGIAVASLGASNRFSFPAPEVRARYTALGSAWRQTDAFGEVAVASDGQLERVATCRAPRTVR